MVTPLQLTLDGEEHVDVPLEGGHTGGAVFSPCRQWRYNLTRQWGPTARSVLWVMLNPSTADEWKLDPTLRRCKGYATAWGFDGMHVRNLFAWRSTSPDVLPTVADPVGPDNDAWLLRGIERFSLVMVAWGTDGALRAPGDDLPRGERVLQRLREHCDPHALVWTKDGHPGHPLYLRRTLEPRPYGS